MIATGIVVLLVAIVLIAHKRYVEHRNALLSTVDFAAGTPEKQVLRVLGAPEQDLRGPNLRQFPGVDAACVGKAARKLGYAPPSPDGGPYVDVYLDENDRVVCVQRGFIAI